MENKKEEINNAEQDRIVIQAIARIKACILGLVLGAIFSVGLFAMTAILLIENGPKTGYHLSLLSNYFIGYSVTWKGACIGALWAFALGFLMGWSIGTIYNAMVNWRKR